MPGKKRPKTQRRPTARPLGGAEVLVAVRGPSPGEGGGKNPSCAIDESADDIHCGAQHREPCEDCTSTAGAKSRQPRDADTFLNDF